MAYRSAQLLSLSSGFSQSFSHSVIQPPLGFPSERSAGKLFWSLWAQSLPAGVGARAGQLGGSSPAECFGPQASAVKRKPGVGWGVEIICITSGRGTERGRAWSCKVQGGCRHPGCSEHPARGSPLCSCRDEACGKPSPAPQKCLDPSPRPHPACPTIPILLTKDHCTSVPQSHASWDPGTLWPSYSSMLRLVLLLLVLHVRLVVGRIHLVKSPGAGHGGDVIFGATGPMGFSLWEIPSLVTARCCGWRRAHGGGLWG